MIRDNADWMLRITIVMVTALCLLKWVAFSATRMAHLLYCRGCPADRMQNKFRKGNRGQQTSGWVTHHRSDPSAVVRMDQLQTILAVRLRATLCTSFENFSTHACHLRLLSTALESALRMSLTHAGAHRLSCFPRRRILRYTSSGCYPLHASDRV